MSAYHEILSFVFPELDHLSPPKRDLALKFSNATPFEFVEWFGIVFGVGLAVILTKDGFAFIDVGSQLFASLLRTLLTVLVTLLLVLPFLIRRTRRGIREYIRNDRD